MGPIRSSVPSLLSRDTKKHDRNLSDGAFGNRGGTILLYIYTSAHACTCTCMCIYDVHTTVHNPCTCMYINACVVWGGGGVLPGLWSVCCFFYHYTTS